MSRTGDPRLDRLIEEVRAEGPAPVDWARVEARLSERLAREPAPAPAPRRDRKRYVAAAVALAASVFAGGLVLTQLDSDRPVDARGDLAERPAPAAPVEELGSSSTALDGETLALGGALVAGSEPLVVRHAGRATWTLDPGSRGRLLANTGAIEVNLESGSVTADVVPGGVPGRFSVVAGEARVSVEGTIFRVERAGDRVLVHVTRGAVSVGPLEGGDRTRVAAPGSAEFDLKGRARNAGESARRPLSGERTPLKDPAATAPSATDAAEAPVAAPPAAEAPQQGDGRTAQQGTEPAAAVRAVVQECFTLNTPPRGDIRITARTRMRVDVKPNGRVQLAEFQPPLAPAVEACVAESLHRLTLSPTPGATRIEEPLSLER